MTSVLSKSQLWQKTHKVIKMQEYSVFVFNTRLTVDRMCSNQSTTEDINDAKTDKQILAHHGLKN